MKCLFSLGSSSVFYTSTFLTPIPAVWILGVISDVTRDWQWMARSTLRPEIPEIVWSNQMRAVLHWSGIPMVRQTVRQFTAPIPISLDDWPDIWPDIDQPHRHNIPTHPPSFLISPPSVLASLGVGVANKSSLLCNIPLFLRQTVIWYQKSTYEVIEKWPWYIYI